MSVDFVESCRRIDIIFRSKYPYFQTKLFQINEHEFELFLINKVDNFEELVQEFNNSIKFIIVPIELVDKKPISYLTEIEFISDREIPLNFSGFPLTRPQIYQHVESIHRDVIIVGMSETWNPSTLHIQLEGNVRPKKIQDVQSTIENLGGFYEVEVIDGGIRQELQEKKLNGYSNNSKNTVFTLMPSSHFKGKGCDFLERDEELWFNKVDDIYAGRFVKDDLFFIDQTKTSCVVNFSKFQNVNLRNHLLLYDIVYIVLPLLTDMSNFFEIQKIHRDELITLIAKGRVIILNMQPETRLDYGYLREIYKEAPNGVVSRRALSALSAMDLVELNSSYIFSDPEIERLGYGFIQEIASITGANTKLLSDFLFWPKAALRNSIDTLNFAGPMAISRFGINNPIVNSLPNHENKDAVEFEFIVNSDQIHIANALDATYFPFFVDNERYTDQPFVEIMGSALNFYKRLDPNLMMDVFNPEKYENKKNLSLDMISIFEVNDFNSILEFEREVSSSVLRGELNTLFFQLSALNESERHELINDYNRKIEAELRIKRQESHGLDLAENAAGLFIPFLGTTKRYGSLSIRALKDKYPVIQSISEYLEEKISPNNQEDRQVSFLTKVNRVAKLKRKFV